MPTKLDLDAAAERGIVFSASRMDNAEFRYRLMRKSERGECGYILTEMPSSDCGWQNSHYHEGLMETYIVQEGWIGYADLMPDGTARFYVYKRGELFTTRPGQKHNVYMPAGAVIHTVKHGDVSIRKDWFGAPELDLLTKHVSEEELHRLAA